MAVESTIRAYQKVLSGWVFKNPSSYSEEFAQKRFRKKFQVPDPTLKSRLEAEAWAEYRANDKRLPDLRNRLLLPEWYRARSTLHRVLQGYKPGALGFPKGTEFTPTRGHNSIEARLSESEWTCTYDNFEAFARLSYSHRALRASAKSRYKEWFSNSNFDISEREANKLLWLRFRSAAGHVPFLIFKWKLERIVSFQHGSRFSTVEKNNQQRRPINVECFANVLTQKTHGAAFRRVLRERLDIDLDSLQSVHRVRVSDPGISTIDLKNASDSISMDLVEFLLPERVVRQLRASRSPLVLGPDDCYYPLRKVSSMGNGFTFELMSLILTVLCKELDPDATVYGDDIIIKTEHAERLMVLLEDVGLQVNRDKSFTSGPFRESCGSNYHSQEGYIESYDFEWPQSLRDCALILAKARFLRKYPSFRALYVALQRVTPKVLQGGPVLDSFPMDPENPNARTPDFLPIFVTDRLYGKRLKEGRVTEALRALCYEPAEFKLVLGITYKNALRSKTERSLKSSQQSKYFMYLHAGRRCDDVISNRGKEGTVTWVSNGRTSFRVQHLLSNL